MRRRPAWTVAVALTPICLSPPADAQQARLGAFAAVVIENEDRPEQDVSVGAGAEAQVVYKRFEGSLSVFRAPLTGSEGGHSVAQVDLAGAYKLHPLVFIEVGVGYRSLKPDISGPDLTWASAGARVQTEFTSAARGWGRGSLMASGRGEAGGAVGADIGFGVLVGSLTGRVGGFLDYRWQRYDLQADVEFSFARFGLMLRP